MDLIGDKSKLVLLNLRIDLEHPKKSTCNCPLAKDKALICKHIVAAYFSIKPMEIGTFKKSRGSFNSLEEEINQKQYDKFLSIAKKLPKSELNVAFAEVMVELEKYRYMEKYKNKN